MILQSGVIADPDQAILCGPEWVYVDGKTFKTISEAYDYWDRVHGDDMNALYDLLEESHGRSDCVS